MIVILSFSFDLTTSRVIEWLIHKKIPFIRINEDDLIKIVSIDIDGKEFCFECRGQKINSRNVSAYWFRKGSINAEICFPRDLKAIMPKYFYKNISNFVNEEYRMTVDFLDGLLKKKKSVDSFASVAHLNKLRVLLAAQSCGLEIPETKIFSTKKQLTEFISLHGEVVGKPISDVIRLETSEGRIYMYTTKIDSVKLSKIPDSFPPSLFQNFIDKKYELRIFVFNGECYSMAIFSQLDPQTAVDFRVYNLANPNRNIPFKLPDEVNKKILRFMKKVNLNSGSIDMILTKQNKFVFLEINPVGQFGMTSYPCNYYLEKMVADFLSS